MRIQGERHRRSLSELVAAILLVFIVVVAGSIVYYAFSYKYSQIHKELARGRADIEESLLESESLSILYVILNVSENREAPPLYIVLGTGLKPPRIGAVYVNGSMVYDGALSLPSTSTVVLKIPTMLNATQGDLVDVEIASVNGVKYSATGYAG